MKINMNENKHEQKIKKKKKTTDQWLSNCETLEDLNVSNAQLTPQGLSSLGDGLRKSKSLRR